MSPYLEMPQPRSASCLSGGTLILDDRWSFRHSQLAGVALSAYHLERQSLDLRHVPGLVRGLERGAVAARLQRLRADLAGELLAVRAELAVLPEAADAREASPLPLLALLDREQHPRLLGERVHEGGALLGALLRADERLRGARAVHAERLVREARRQEHGRDRVLALGRRRLRDRLHGDRDRGHVRGGGPVARPVGERVGPVVV